MSELLIGEKAKCLLVDDRRENIVALQALLRQDEIQLFHAYSGAEALELLLIHDFALAIVDVQMPGMSGFELAELMHGTERTKNVPIIFVTAGAIDSNLPIEGYQSGAVDFLYKPLDARVVKSKVRVFQELYRQKMLLKKQLEKTEDTLNALKKTEEALSLALRVREDFLSIASHELKTPITSMLLQVQMVRRNIKADPQGALAPERSAKFFDICERQLNRLNTMVGELLDVSRMQAGKLSIDPHPTDLGELVTQVLERLGPQLAAAGCTVELNLEPNIIARCDAFRTEQVLDNLLVNAIKYAPRTKVLVAVAQQGQFAQLAVQDAGPGISDEKLPAIFNKFERADAERSITGLGLGLYIVKQIMAAHGGSISVKNVSPSGPAGTDGGGARFVASFPLALT